MRARRSLPWPVGRLVTSLHGPTEKRVRLLSCVPERPHAEALRRNVTVACVAVVEACIMVPKRASLERTATRGEVRVVMAVQLVVIEPDAGCLHAPPQPSMLPAPSERAKPMKVPAASGAVSVTMVYSGMAGMYS